MEKLLTNVLDKSSQQADLCLNESNENTLRTFMLQYYLHYKTKYVSGIFNNLFGVPTNLIVDSLQQTILPM